MRKNSSPLICYKKTISILKKFLSQVHFRPQIFLLRPHSFTIVYDPNSAFWLDSTLKLYVMSFVGLHTCIGRFVSYKLMSVGTSHDKRSQVLEAEAKILASRPDWGGHETSTCLVSTTIRLTTCNERQESTNKRSTFSPQLGRQGRCFVSPFRNTPFTRYNRLLSNQLNNRLNVCLHDAAGCSTGFTTVVSCKSVLKASLNASKKINAVKNYEESVSATQGISSSL